MGATAPTLFHILYIFVFGNKIFLWEIDRIFLIFWWLKSLDPSYAWVALALFLIHLNTLNNMMGANAPTLFYYLYMFVCANSVRPAKW